MTDRLVLSDKKHKVTRLQHGGEQQRSNSVIALEQETSRSPEKRKVVRQASLNKPKMVDRVNRSQVSLDHVAEENEGSESHHLGSMRVTERGELNIANLRNFDR
jgi:hypothetical protein